ncbi:MAG: aminodeoxychorismate synthase component I [Saprospiraceae bacterium]|nr:aminodeoxychorismate synthase component I [Saprospiraceae bacterium]MBP6695827.1 aminodeoxychorismate synthase component I [Saprospiraceae bacterium]
MFYPEGNNLPFVRQMNHLGKDRIPFFFLIDFEMAKPLVLPIKDIDKEKIKYKFTEVKNYQLHASANTPPLIFSKFPMAADKYKKAFDYVKGELLYGNSFLTNLTFPTRIESNYSLLQLFNKSRAKYKLYFNDEFIVFSPETFVTINTNGVIHSFPMKGTIEAGIPDAIKKLMEDEKEIAEHYTIVDLIRNDIGIVSENVEVKKFRYLDLITTTEKKLYQTSSTIEGKLYKNYHEHLGDIFLSLLPAGSISGAPKKKTVEIIQKAEGEDRGYYTGIMGYYDGESVDSGVMIRYIEKRGDRLFFRSGCGITAMSDCESEYKEMIDKVYVPVG